MYTVKTDIPPPANGGQHGSTRRYPWPEMQPGSRFDLALDGEPGGLVAIRNRIYGSFLSWRKARASRAGLRIVCRVLRHDGVMRVWLVGDQTAADDLPAGVRDRSEPIRWPFDQMRRPEPETVPNAGTAHGHAASVAEFERVARCARQNFRRWRAADPARAGLQFQIYADGRAGQIIAWVTGSKDEAAHARDTWWSRANPPPPPMPGMPPAWPVRAPAAPAPKPATVPAAPAAPAVASAEPDFGDW